MFQKIVKGSIYLLVFLLPLFWLPFTFEVFELNKTYLLFVLVSVGFLAWLGRMIFEEKKFRIRTGPLDIFVLVYLLIMVLNAVFSIDKVSSIFGFYGRFWPNLVGVLSLGFFYFLLTNNITVKSQAPNPNDQQNPKSQIPKNKNRSSVISHRSLLKTFLWSSFFVVLITYLSVFGVWAKFGKILRLPAVMLFKGFNTVGGSFEQLAVFLAVIFVFLTVFLAFGSKKSFWLYLFLAALFFLLVLIDFWPSWLLIFLSLGVFLAFSFWKRVFKEDVNRLSLPVLLLLISFLLLFANPFSGILRQLPVFAGWPREALLSQGMSWNIGFDGLANNIVFGSGENTFSYLFSQYRPQSFVQEPFWQIRFDRAGSHIAELLGTTGAMGSLSYLALLGMFLLVSGVVLGANKKRESLALRVPLAAAFFALLIGQFVFYQNTVLGFSFWFVLSLGVISWDKVQKEKTFDFKDFPEVGLIFNILFYVFLLAAGYFWFMMAKFYAADIFYKNYLVSSQNNIQTMEKAVKFNGFRMEYHSALAGGYLGKVYEEARKENPDRDLLVNMAALAIREGQEAARVAPRRVAAKEVLGVVYRELQVIAQGALEWGIKTFRAALEGEPNNPILMTELGKLLILDNQQESARELFSKAAALRKDYAEPTIQLALLKEKEKNIDEAQKLLEEFITRAPFSLEARFHLGRIYFNQKEYDKAIVQFQNVLTLFPGHSNALYSLGLAFQNKGETELALEQFNRVLELNPGNKMVLEKIEELKFEGGKSEEQGED